MPEKPNATSEPTVPVSNSDSEGWFKDAPGGDALFGELFPGEEEFPGAEPTAVEPAQEVAPVEPQAPTEPVQPTGPYFKGAHSVYETQEALQAGVNQKDEIIERYRQEGIQRDGIDPLTKKTVAQPPSSYLEDKTQFFQDLRSAVDKNDEAAYMTVQQKLIDDTLNERFQGVAPMLEQLARTQALDNAGSDVQEIRTFLQSPEYKAVLEDNSSLKNAIEISEGDFKFQSELPGLYKLAYNASQGMRLPELLKAQASTGTQTPQPTQQVRPTQTAGTMSPPNTAGPVEPDWTTSEGRQEIIRRSQAVAEQVKW